MMSFRIGDILELTWNHPPVVAKVVQSHAILSHCTILRLTRPIAPTGGGLDFARRSSDNPIIVTIGQKFVAAVKIAAQALPVTSALAQALAEIEGARFNARLEQVEGKLSEAIQEPLAEYGPRARELSAILYSLIRAQPQDVPTTHLDWNSSLDPFRKELRHMEADELLRGSHATGPGGEFRAGFRMNRGFIVYLALLHDAPELVQNLTAAMDEATDQLDGREVRKTIDLPLIVIDSFFDDYVRRGQGFKSGEVGRSLYIPKQ